MICNGPHTANLCTTTNHHWQLRHYQTEQRMLQLFREAQGQHMLVKTSCLQVPPQTPYQSLH